jgi:hypothetical protein
VLLKLREPLPPDSDEDSEDGDSVDSDEDQPWENEDHFHDAQRQFEDQEDDELQEKAEKFRLGKVDRRMKKHFNPTVKAGAKLLWGVKFKEVPDRRRPKSNPYTGLSYKEEEDEEHLPDFDPDEEKEDEYDEQDE